MASPALRLRAFVASSLAVPLLVLGAAASAELANLTDVRVGVHGDHTRIVLETDGKAPYIVDATEREVVIHVDAAASAEAVTAKSPHLLWAKVEPTAIGSDVRISLKQPADVKAMVLTSPHRIVLDLYPKKGAPAPLPAPELIVEEEPAVTAEAEPPTFVPAPTPEELEKELGLVEVEESPEADESAEDAEVAEVGAAPAEEVEAEPAEGGEEVSDEETAAAGEEPAVAAAEEAAPPVPIARVERPERPRPERTAPPEPSGGLFGSPYLLGAAMAALFALLLFVRRRLRAPSSKVTFPDVGEEESAPYEPTQRAVPVGAPAASGESLFDVEPEALDALPKEEEAQSFLRRGGRAASGEETERRIAQLERRIEELVDGRERLERQVAAQTEELRVQRAAIARTQRVLRTVAPRTDDEPSSEPVRG